MKKYYHYDNYNSICNNYKNWVRKAEELLIASSFLEEAYNDAQTEMQKETEDSQPVPDGYYCFYPKHLLWAIALENYFKAVYLKNKGDLCMEGRYMGYKGHRLIEWSNKTDLKFKKKENELLERLTFVLETLGKYPVPLKKESFKRKTKIPGTKIIGYQPVFYSLKTDQFYIESILEKIKLKLK